MDNSVLRLFDQIPELFLIMTPEGKFQKVNTAFVNCLQYSNDELQWKDYTSIHVHDNQVEFPQLMEKLTANRQLTDIIHTLQKKDGTEYIINWSLTLLDKEILCIGRPWIPAASYQPQFQKEHLFEALVEHSLDFLAVTDAAGIWTYVSESMAALLQQKPNDLVGQYCFNYIHPDDLPQIGAQMQMLTEGKRKIQSPAYRFKNGNGEWLWMEAIVANQLDNPDINGIVITGRDISDRILAEKNAKEIQLLEALRDGEEKERSRISRDLHDEISGMVAAAKMHLATLGNLAPAVEGHQDYQQGLKLLDEAAQQIRRTSHNLMPEILLEKGLDKALNRYANSLSNSQLQLRYVAMGNVRRYTPGFELAIYRIVQELLNNIVKHSKASEAILQLSFQAHLLSMTIEDNGIGFEHNLENGGTGLRSIRNRVAVMNGSIEIESVRQKGTSIYLEFAQ